MTILPRSCVLSFLLWCVGWGDFAYEDKMNMNYSLDGLHLNDLGYNILNVRLSKEL